MSSSGGSGLGSGSGGSRGRAESGPGHGEAAFTAAEAEGEGVSGPIADFEALTRPEDVDEADLQAAAELADMDRIRAAVEDKHGSNRPGDGASSEAVTWDQAVEQLRAGRAEALDLPNDATLEEVTEQVAAGIKGRNRAVSFGGARNAGQKVPEDQAPEDQAPEDRGEAEVSAEQSGTEPITTHEEARAASERYQNPTPEQAAAMNKRSGEMFQSLLEQESQSGVESVEAPERVSADIENMDFIALSNYMISFRQGEMPNGQKVSEFREIAQGSNGEWLLKITRTTDAGHVQEVKGYQSSSLRDLEREATRGLVDDGEDLEKSEELRCDLEWNEEAQGYYCTALDENGAKVDFPEDLKDMIASELRPNWTVVLEGSEALIKKADGSRDGLLDQVLDMSFDNDLSKDREMNPQDAVGVRSGVDNGVNEYNRQFA
ncbi:MAG TPA: hypothetical protein VF272_02615 [Candidatus Saccharimonadia bacterium]